MPDPGLRRLVVGVTLLLAVTGLAGCGGGDDEDDRTTAPADAAAGDFCRTLEDAPAADATADDYHAYAERLQDTGTPRDITGDARQGFELFVGYLAEVEDGDVATVKGAVGPSDVFSGAEAARVESFKQGYVATCQDGADDAPGTSGTPTADPTGGILPGLGDGGAGASAP